MLQNNRNKTEERAMEISNFLQRLWNVELPENQRFSNKNYGNH